MDEQQEEYGVPLTPEPAGLEPMPRPKRMRQQRSGDSKRTAHAKAETLWRKKTRHLKAVSRFARGNLTGGRS